MRISQDPQVSAMDNFVYTDETLRARFDAALSGKVSPNGTRTLMVVIEDPSNGNVIGLAGGLLEASTRGTQTLIVAYAAAPEYWGRGIMSEAAESAIQGWLRKYRITDLGALVASSNTRSQALLRRLGFVATTQLEATDLGMPMIRPEPIIFFQRPIPRAP
jgi:RimJ/RimL family protein N-acetyltransferase